MFGRARCCCRLAVSDISHRRLVELAAPILDEIGSVTHETVNLSSPMRDGVNHLAQVDSDYLVGTDELGGAVGSRCTARRPGRCSSPSGLPSCRRDRSTGSRSTRSRTGRRSRKDLELARRRGFALTVDELELGLSAVAAPVRDRSGSVVAALSVSGPSMRLGLERLQSHGRLLCAGRRSPLEPSRPAVRASREMAG